MAVEAAEVPVGAAGRRFVLSDGMILLAGLALAFAAGAHLWVLLARQFVGVGWEVWAYLGDRPRQRLGLVEATREHLRNLLWYGCQVGESLMIGLTPAWVVVRLRRPRPPWRALLRQPGVVAVLAMVFGAFWGTGALAVLFPDLSRNVGALPVAMAGSVAVAWGVLAACRAWRPEAGWVDRMGRVLGWSALVLAVARVLVFRI